MPARKSPEQKLEEAKKKLDDLYEDIQAKQELYNRVVDPDKPKTPTLIKLERLIQDKIIKRDKVNADFKQAQLKIKRKEEKEKEHQAKEAKRKAQIAEIDETLEEIKEAIGEGVTTQAKQEAYEKFEESKRGRQSESATKRHAGKSQAQRKLDMIPANKAKALKRATNDQQRKQIETKYAEKQANLRKQVQEESKTKTKAPGPPTTPRTIKTLKKEEKEEQEDQPFDDLRAMLSGSISGKRTQAVTPEELTEEEEEKALTPEEKKQKEQKEEKEREETQKRDIEKLAKQIEGDKTRAKQAKIQARKPKGGPTPAPPPEEEEPFLSRLTRELQQEKERVEKDEPLFSRITRELQEEDIRARPEAYKEGERRRAEKEVGPFVRGVKKAMREGKESLKIAETFADRSRSFTGAHEEKYPVSPDIDLSTMHHYGPEYQQVFDDLEASGLSRDQFERATGSSVPRRPTREEHERDIYIDGRGVNSGTTDEIELKYDDTRHDDLDWAVDERLRAIQADKNRRSIVQYVEAREEDGEEVLLEVKEGDIEIRTRQENLINNLNEYENFLDNMLSDPEYGIGVGIIDEGEPGFDIPEGAVPPVAWSRISNEYLRARARNRLSDNLLFLRDYMRNNRIRSNVNLSEMSAGAINSLATNLGRAGGAINSFQARYGVDLQLFNELRQWGALDPVLNHPKVKNTRVGQGLAELNKQTLKGGKLASMGPKFQKIMEGIFAGGRIAGKIANKDLSGLSKDLIDVSQGARSGVNIYTGVKNVVRKFAGKPDQDPTATTTKGMTDQESKIIEELERLNKMQQRPQDRRPEMVDISGNIYKFPGPNENRNANLLIQNAVNAYMNDKNMFGSYYDNHDI